MEINTDYPQMAISSSNARKVALAILKPYPTKILPVEINGKVHLLVSVKVRENALKL